MTTAIINQAQAEVMPVQAHSDNQLIALWLHGRPASTVKVYQEATKRLLTFIDKPLQAITLADLQSFADSLAALGDNTRKRLINSIKSLFTFGQKLGYLRFNVAA